MRRLLPFFLLFCLSACNAKTDQQIASPLKTTLPAGTFHFDENGGSGVAYVKGFTEITQVDEPFCEKDCKKFSYVWFSAEETGSAELEKFFTGNEGNAYVRKGSSGGNLIGLGCAEDGVISFVNDSDENGEQDVKLSAALSGDILTSTKEEPIILELTKSKLTGGKEAPACYAHFSQVEKYEVM